MPVDDENDAVAICSDCGNIMPDSKAYANAFLQEGYAAPCKMCGGVVIVANKANAKQAVEKSKKDRGL
jgi:DNA-directed RNA polymerase subunit RPC12/RpoP